MTPYPYHYRCATCKNEHLRGVRNGDLYCDKCNNWVDPDEPEEAHLLEYAVYSDTPIIWKNSRDRFVD